MTINEIKEAINKDNKLPEDVKNILKKDLNTWLSKIGELYLLSPTLEVCSVGLGLLDPQIRSNISYIPITNIFRLNTILGIKLYAKKYSDTQYIIYCNALGYPFMETVSDELYRQVYKGMSELISEFDIFHPYSY